MLPQLYILCHPWPVLLVVPHLGAVRSLHLWCAVAPRGCLGEPFESSASLSKVGLGRYTAHWDLFCKWHNWLVALQIGVEHLHVLVFRYCFWQGDVSFWTWILTESSVTVDDWWKPSQTSNILEYSFDCVCTCNRKVGETFCTVYKYMCHTQFLSNPLFWFLLLDFNVGTCQMFSNCEKHDYSMTSHVLWSASSLNWTGAGTFFLF